MKRLLIAAALLAFPVKSSQAQLLVDDNCGCIAQEYVADFAPEVTFATETYIIEPRPHYAPRPYYEPRRHYPPRYYEPRRHYAVPPPYYRYRREY